jgi:hypothetical protein
MHATCSSKMQKPHLADARPRFYDVEAFHAQYGAGALVATPLFSSQEAERLGESYGNAGKKAFGVLLVDLDVQPGTPMDYRWGCSHTDLVPFS